MAKSPNHEQPAGTLNRKQYCFPNMLTGFSVDEKKPEERKSFRRISFDENGSRYFTSYEQDQESQSENQSNESFDDAYSQGYEQGENEGFKSIISRFEPILNSLQQAVKNVENTRERLMASAESSAVELAIAIAEKIICCEVTINKDHILSVVKTALNNGGDHKKIKIKLRSRDLELLKEISPKLLAPKGEFESITFEEDNSITMGGCLIETNQGDIDARFEKQLQAVKEAFRSEIDKLSAGG